MSSNSHKGNHYSSHDNSSTFYEGDQDVSPPASVNTFDFNALTDDEVRERFQLVMVCIDLSNECQH